MGLLANTIEANKIKIVHEDGLFKVYAGTRLVDVFLTIEEKTIENAMQKVAELTIEAGMDAAIDEFKNKIPQLQIEIASLYASHHRSICRPKKFLGIF